MESYIKKFSETGITDVPVVGGKNASLGEMFSKLTDKGIRVPDGFATTAAAFWHFMDYNKMGPVLRELLRGLDRDKFSNLSETGSKARALIQNALMPQDLADAITGAYKTLCGAHFSDVAVRSSATAEDLPEASFAGQHESFLNIRGEEPLLEAVKKCYVSLYTDRAIKYREDNGFAHEKVALSVGIQKMVRSDKACSGVGFTLEPESGFRDIIHLAGVWGLGENIVQGQATPDEFLVFKPSLAEGRRAIIQKRLGKKEKTMVYADKEAGAGIHTLNLDTPVEKRRQFVLTDDEVTSLAIWASVIEHHYGKPMDIEWAKDGLTGELFIVQARPETVQSRKNPMLVKEYELIQKGETLAQGEAVGAQVISGRARILASPEKAGDLKEGEIIVTDLTSPDWDPILKKAGGIVTNKGGRTSHASIVARELGVPAIVGTGDATEKIKDGETITLSCSEGKTGSVYRGKSVWAERQLDLSRIKMPDHTRPMLIIADPDKAFELSFYPNEGVGLLRMEFIITHFVGIHPMALVKFETLKDGSVKQRISELTGLYTDKRHYFVDQLTQGIATIAAAFYPKEVIVRMSDFKTNEYANLLGGHDFEPKEENPMLGFR
ncbi:MAG: phosphoenolpyruvate synthase, partial [Bacteroidota bacterium]